MENNNKFYTEGDKDVPIRFQQIFYGDYVERNWGYGMMLWGDLFEILNNKSEYNIKTFEEAFEEYIEYYIRNSIICDMYTTDKEYKINIPTIKCGLILLYLYKNDAKKEDVDNLSNTYYKELNELSNIELKRKFDDTLVQLIEILTYRNSKEEQLEFSKKFSKEPPKPRRIRRKIH